MSIHKIQLFPFEDIELWPTVYLILYPSLKNSITRTTIVLIVRIGNLSQIQSVFSAIDSFCHFWTFLELESKDIKKGSITASEQETAGLTR